MSATPRRFRTNAGKGSDYSKFQNFSLICSPRGRAPQGQHRCHQRHHPRQPCSGEDAPLLQGDRLYGPPWLLWEPGQASQQNGSHFLVRVKDNLKVPRHRRPDDGSPLVSVAATDPSAGKNAGSLILREIHATMHGETTRRTVRLWTALWDPAEHPAPGMAGLCTTRWEDELFFRKLKTHWWDHRLHFCWSRAFPADLVGTFSRTPPSGVVQTRSGPQPRWG